MRHRNQQTLGILIDHPLQKTIANARLAMRNSAIVEGGFIRSALDNG